MSARVLAILERAGGSTSRDEVAYQIGRCLRPRESVAVDFGVLVAAGLVDMPGDGSVTITEKGRRALDGAEVVDRVPQAANGAHERSERIVRAPSPPTVAPARFALPDGVPVRRQREATAKGELSVAFTVEELVDRVRAWARITGAPPARCHWSGAHARKLAATAADRADRWRFLVNLYEQGDFPALTSIRKRKDIPGGFQGLIRMAGYEPRATGRTPRDHPGFKSYAGQPATLAGQTTRAIGRVLTARERGDKAKLRDALYALRDIAEREADSL